MERRVAIAKKERDECIEIKNFGRQPVSQVSRHEKPSTVACVFKVLTAFVRIDGYYT